MPNEIIAVAGEATVTSLVSSANGSPTSGTTWAMFSVVFGAVALYSGRKVPSWLMSGLDSEIQKGKGLFNICKDRHIYGTAIERRLAEEIDNIKEDARLLHAETLEMRLHWRKAFLGVFALSYKIWRCRDRAEAFVVRRELDYIQYNARRAN